jgi:tRNA A-37 threonylcarbamoyl transferase component Bud32
LRANSFVKFVAAVMEMNDICPHCGKSIPETVLGGVCAECMMKVGLAETGQIGPCGAAFSKPHRQPAPSVADLAPHFPQLELLECLGCGGMGAVYRARQPKIDRYVALKILTRTSSEVTDTEFAGRFQREARALARLNHSGIVAVYDFGEAGGYHYLLMEYVDGLNLRQVLQARRLAPVEALDIVPKICEALQFAHDRGIVHRDIKPENILLNKQGEVKIADFGIAKIVGIAPEKEALTGAKDIIGTPHYMAPEQIEQPHRVDHRADIYSLGVVFYEILTGELPLGKFPPPSFKVLLDGRLDAVVLRALEKEPQRRYQRVSQVKTDVETIAGATPPGSTIDERPAAVRKPRLHWLRECSGIASDTRCLAIAARWTARVLGTLMLLFYGAFILGQGLPPLASQPGGVQLNFIALGLILGGFVIGWKREGSAALLIAAGWTIWHISEGRFSLNLFQAPLAVAALYTFCWWRIRGRRTGVLAAATAGLAVMFVLGRLFVPANVHLSGTIIDAATDHPIAEARMFLSREPVADPELVPNTRSRADGRFNLYVGWHRKDLMLTIAAPGYQLLQAKLPARPLGGRRLTQNYRLASIDGAAGIMPVPNAAAFAGIELAPPVVTETIPQSGATEVDPALTELRITFSKEMRDSDLPESTWAGENVPRLTGPPQFIANRRTCVLPVQLERGKTYAVWLNSENNHDFKDQNGQPAVPYLLIFKTRTEL